MWLFGGTSVVRVIARRTPARADWTRVDGETARVDSGRAVRRTGSRRARAFSSVSATARHAKKLSDAGVGDASRRRNHARFFARTGFKKRSCVGDGRKSGGAENKIVFHGVCHALAIA